MLGFRLAEALAAAHSSIVVWMVTVCGRHIMAGAGPNGDITNSWVHEIITRAKGVIGR
jgi:hypothetical protein